MPNSRRTYFCAFLPIPFFQVDAKPDEGKIYRRAARNLREYHGVPSMTPPKLIQTLAFLKLHPRRLVKQGLAPAHLLAGVQAPEPLGSDNNDDLVEVVASDMELMSVEDDRKNDGFVSVGDGEMPVSYTHLRAHETRHDLVCRLLLEKKK